MHHPGIGKNGIRIINGFVALVATTGIALPAYSAPADSNSTFRDAAPQVTSQDSLPLADDTLLVLLSPNADRSKVANDLQNESQSTVVKDNHVQRENYSVLQVKPAKGQHLAALNKINQMRSNHAEILSVSENILLHRLGSLDTVPNDPDFSQQWPLTAMRYPAARTNFSNGTFTQKHPPYITVLADGCDPVSTNNELGAYVTQYNATGTNIVQESVHGTFATGGGEGDVDTSITSCLTDNGTLMSGYASFAQNNPCYITMLRMTNSGSVSTATILNALTWAVNNQKLRGGPGPVNLSYGTSYPHTPLWSNSSIQSLARSLQKQGDLLVIAAGDTAGTYSSKYTPGAAVVVQGTDSTNKFYSRYLTLLQNDGAAAPGAPQPGVLGGAYTTQYYGSSFSAPFWCASIAMCMSVNPSLTALQAHQIVLATGTKVSGAKWPAVVPALDLAIARAAGTK